MTTRDRARESPGEYRVALSATEAARNFSEILNRVKHRGESFLIERGGEAICEIKPISASSRTVKGSDLDALLRSLPPVDEDYLTTVEAIARNQPLLPESPWER